jgi:hypothetical protein
MGSILYKCASYASYKEGKIQLDALASDYSTHDLHIDIILYLCQLLPEGRARGVAEVDIFK